MLFCPSCFCLARQNLPCAHALNYVLKWRLLEIVALMWRHLSLLSTRINSVVVHFATMRQEVTHISWQCNHRNELKKIGKRIGGHI